MAGLIVRKDIDLVRERADEAARRRVVLDQVASLTDSTALEWHHTLVQGAEFRRVWI